MGQVENKDKGFTIKGDGTIVRNETVPNVERMKKKLTTGTNRNSQSEEDSSLKTTDGVFSCLSVLIALGCMIFGAISQYDSSGGNLFVTIITSILCGALGGICSACVLGFLVVLYEVIFKKNE